MKLLRFGLGLALATALQTLGTALVPRFAEAIDLFLVLAVWNAITSSVRWSMVGGSVAGLCRDALSGGFYGLHGFADTLVAFVAVRVQQRLLVQAPLQIGFLFTLAAALQLATLMTLQALLIPGSEMPGIGSSVVRMVCCGLLGMILSISSARIQTTFERWREQRRRRLRISV